MPGTTCTRVTRPGLPAIESARSTTAVEPGWRSTATRTLLKPVTAVWVPAEVDGTTSTGRVARRATCSATDLKRKRSRPERERSLVPITIRSARRAVACSRITPAGSPC